MGMEVHIDRRRRHLGLEIECECINISETIRRSPPPLIIKHPSDVMVRIGQQEPAYLTCHAEQSVLYDWYKEGQLFARGETNGQLELFPVSAAHLGKYYCVVVNDGGKERSNTAMVILSK